MKEIRTHAAPAPVGPYSQAIESDGWIFVSGQIPLDPETNALVDGEIEAQATRVLANLRAVLEAAGASLQDVVRTTIYLVDLELFPRVNAVYAEHFSSEPQPARHRPGRSASARRHAGDRRHRPPARSEPALASPRE